MKTFGVSFLISGACLFAGVAAASPISAPRSSAADGHSPYSTMIQQVADGDAPMPGRRRRAGGQRREGKKKDLSPGLPAMNGATREDADKEYKKKYGF